MNYHSIVEVLRKVPKIGRNPKEQGAWKNRKRKKKEKTELDRWKT